MARKQPKVTFTTRVLRAGEAFFRTPETERNELRRLVAENIVLNNTNGALAHKVGQLAQFIETELHKHQHDADLHAQLLKDLAWEKQNRIALEEQLKNKETKQTEN